MPKKRYIIVTSSPAYKSMGTRMLHKLHDALRMRGYEAFMFCPQGHIPGYHYLETFDIQTRKRDVVVYSETVIGNPLRFNNIVRYVLYYPGISGGEYPFYPSENIFTWEKKYYPGAPQLYLEWLDTSLFFDEHLPKTQDCYFVNKGGKWKELGELNGLTEINMNYPESRYDLAKLLKTTGILYSYDSDSAILAEAICCGAKVKIITKNGFKDANLEMPSKAEMERQLDDFITLTQSLNYHGPLQEYTAQYKFKQFRRRMMLPLLKSLNTVCRNQKLNKMITRYTLKLKERGYLGVLKEG